MELAIITEKQAISHMKVAQDIYNVLKTRCNCNLYDWGEAKIPEKNILFVATMLNTSLHYLSRFLPKKRIVFYATLEGEPIIDPIARQIAKNVKIVAVSHFVKEMIHSVELHCEDVVYHGIDMNDTQEDPRFRQFLETIQHHPNKPKTRKRKYLTVSGNMKRKGLDRLMVAHKIVEFNHKDAVCILHSGGGYVNTAQLADQLEISFSSFWFTNAFGLYDNYQMNTLYKFADFYVQPSLTGGFELPLAEALKHRRPVIAIDAPPFNEIIKPEKTGILIPVRKTTREKFLNRIILIMKHYSVNDLAEAISTLLNDKYRKRLKQNITKEVKMRFDSANTYPGLLKFFE
jgi:glycosyltransferase involved in cell wall biosynthesis